MNVNRSSVRRRDDDAFSVSIVQNAMLRTVLDKIHLLQSKRLRYVFPRLAVCFAWSDKEGTETCHYPNALESGAKGKSADVCHTARFACMRFTAGCLSLSRWYATAYSCTHFTT